MQMQNIRILDSVYSFILSKSRVGIVLIFCIVVIQIVILLLFLHSAFNPKERTMTIYTYDKNIFNPIPKLTCHGPKCPPPKFSTFGLTVFVSILVGGIFPDVVTGVKIFQLYFSLQPCNNKSQNHNIFDRSGYLPRLLFLAIVSLAIPLLTFTVALIFNKIYSKSETDLVTNVVLLIVVNHMDKKILMCLCHLCPYWVRRRKIEVSVSISKMVAMYRKDMQV